jgi:hypothetical protein
MKKRSGSVSGPSPYPVGGNTKIVPVSKESISHISPSVDYSHQWIFDEIRDDILEVIKKYGDSYDIRQQGRSNTRAFFVLSPDSVRIYQNLVADFSSRSEFSMNIEIPPTAKQESEPTVVIYRASKPAPTTRQIIVRNSWYVIGATFAFLYLAYLA